jgi:tagaturonate reductase
MRSLPDDLIDRANRQGIFNGRVVVVEWSLTNAALFEKQDCLYTVQQNSTVRYSINASISRVLPAKEEWQQVLECAHNPEMKLILSHTATEAFRLINDDVRLHPPKTFPGQLLAFLYERYKAFGGSVQSGLVIVPTEALPENGKRLETVVFELAHLNGLEDGFIEWLESCNQFCNSSFDGVAPNGAETGAQALLKAEAGYTDPLLVVTDEKQRWTIEGDETIKKVVSFALADGVGQTSHASRQGTVNLQEP